MPPPQVLLHLLHDPQSTHHLLQLLWPFWGGKHNEPLLANISIYAYGGGLSVCACAATTGLVPFAYIRLLELDCCCYKYTCKGMCLTSRYLCNIIRIRLLFSLIMPLPHEPQAVAWTIPLAGISFWDMDKWVIKTHWRKYVWNSLIRKQSYKPLPDMERCILWFTCYVS